MTKLDLSPSLIDSHRYYLNCEEGSPSEAKALEELIASIKREPRPMSEAMALGLAWHKALEGDRPLLDQVNVVLDNGARYAFDADGVRQAMDARPPRTNAEMWGELECRDAFLTLRADGVSGNEVHEVKSTTRDPDVEKYMRTMQWRAYLLAFSCDVAVYHICKLGWDEPRSVYTLEDIATFRQYPYPSMRQDVEASVSALADFIRAQGLEKYRARPAWKDRKRGSA